MLSVNLNAFYSVLGARHSSRHRGQGHGESYSPVAVRHHDAATPATERARGPRSERLLRGTPRGQVPHRRPGRHREMQRVH